MTTQVLQQITDNGGNIGWVVIDTTQTFTDPVAASSYIQTLPPGNYMVELWDGTNATILAVN